MALYGGGLTAGGLTSPLRRLRPDQEPLTGMQPLPGLTFPTAPTAAPTPPPTPSPLAGITKPLGLPQPNPGITQMAPPPPIMAPSIGVNTNRPSVTLSDMVKTGNIQANGGALPPAQNTPGGLVGFDPTGVEQPVLRATPPAKPSGLAGIRPGTFPAEGGPLQDFGPGNDLRGTQINPYTGERLRGIQGDTDILFRNLTQGPNLTDAALEKFKLLGEQTQEQRGQGIRQIGQAAARLGRLGSGMVTTDLGNLEDVLRTREEQARRGLASDLAFSEGSERRANLGAAQGLEDQVYGQGRGARDEARGERAYQEDQARRAQDIDILRRQLEQQYEEQLRRLGLQGAGLYGDQAAASSDAAASLLGGSF